MNHRIRVDLGDRGYDISIAPNARASLADELRAIVNPSKIAVVTSPTLRTLYAEDIVADLARAGHDAWLAEMPDGEQHKTLDTAVLLYDQFLAHRMERLSLVVAVGGGVVGDVAGFAAATYMRGVPFVQVPTTLIAQVDSSVGGKTAVDHALGKNLIGAFHQPRLVLIDVETLMSLPKRELVAGLAEVVRYAVIQSPSLFELLQSRMADILARDMEALTEIVRRSVGIKARIVEQDETESGLRGTLNYGHTFGHAIEAVTAYARFLHGEAVAIGMQCAAEMAAARGMVDRAFCDQQRDLLLAAGLPVSCPTDIDLAAVVDAMKLDKKVQDGRIRFVVPSGIGAVEMRNDFTDADATAAMEATTS